MSLPTTTPTDTSRPPKRAAALPLDERRSMIVAATLPLLLENGEMVTTRQIADAAGIAEGTIFRAFADKDELIGAVLDTALDTEALERALAAIDPALPLEQGLRRAVEILQRRVVDVWRLASSVGPRFQERAQRPIDDIDTLVALMEAYRPHLRVKPVVAARLLRAFTLSLTHPMLVGQATPPREIVQIFLHGVSTGDGRC